MSPRPVRRMSASAKRRDVRCASGVEGLDDILAGGLPRDCFYLVQGDPGSGRTTLALQFLLEGLRRGEKVFYITLSETGRNYSKWRAPTAGQSIKFPFWIYRLWKIYSGRKRRRRCFIHRKSS